MTGGAATEGKQGSQGLAAALASLKLPLGLLLLVPVAPVLHYLVGASPTWVFLAGAVAGRLLLRRVPQRLFELITISLAGAAAIRLIAFN